MGDATTGGVGHRRVGDPDAADDSGYLTDEPDDGDGLLARLRGVL